MFSFIQIITKIILSNKVKINDNIVNELGVKIDPSKDKVFYNGKRILPEENKLYIMLNKPEGYITSVKDEKGRYNSWWMA